MNILLLVDHKWRDLPGHVLIQLLGQRRGHTISFVRNGFQWDAAWHHRPDVLVVNHLLEPSAITEVRKLAEAGIATVVLPTEGIPTIQGSQDLHAGAGHDYTGVARFCVWSEAMKASMVKHRVLDGDHIPVIGVPRFDFYYPPVNAIFPSRVSVCQRYKLDPRRPVLLWATNFALSAAWERDSKFSQNDWLKLGLVKTLGYGATTAHQDAACREASFDAIRTVMERHADWQVLVKLHPSDNTVWFHDKVRSLPAGRYALADTAYIWETLPAADVLIKRSCTTGVEAWIRGQPTIEFQPRPERIYFSPEHAAGSLIAIDADSLDQHVSRILSGDKEPDDICKARQDFIDRWCFKADGHASERFLDVLDDVQAERRDRGITTRRCAPGNTITRRLRHRILTACDHFLHDRRLYGWSGRLDRLGRIDKWYRHADARAWRSRIAPFLPHETAPHAG